MHSKAYCLLPLYRRDGSIAGWTKVDRETYGALSQFRWCMNNGYAVRNVGYSSVKMHRELMGLGSWGEDPLEVDHMNRDRSDNRRANLRIVTKAENARNQPSNRNSSSQYRGVSWIPKNKKWKAHVRVDGVLIHLGYFWEEKEAGDKARAYRESLGWLD